MTADAHPMAKDPELGAALSPWRTDSPPEMVRVVLYMFPSRVAVGYRWRAPPRLMGFRRSQTYRLDDGTIVHTITHWAPIPGSEQAVLEQLFHEQQKART